MKKLIPLAMLSVFVGLGASNVDSLSFSYKYEIRAATMAYNDQLMLYTYKKVLINTYEELCLSSPSSLHDEIIRNNMNRFTVSENISVSLKYGTIVLIDGAGLGPSIRGDLRKSICDDNPIDTRFFFYDIFNK